MVAFLLLVQPIVLSVSAGQRYGRSGSIKKKKKKFNHFRDTGGDFSPTGKCS